MSSRDNKTSLLVASAGALLTLVVVTAAVISLNLTSPGSLPFGATYQPLPRAATTHGELTLTQLSPELYKSVKISPTTALTTAESITGIATTKGVTETTSLGSFTDAQLRHDGVLIAKSTPAYVVIFSGLAFATLGPTAGIVKNDAVAVNASTGKVLESVHFN